MNNPLICIDVKIKTNESANFVIFENDNLEEAVNNFASKHCIISYFYWLTRYRIERFEKIHSFGDDQVAG